MKADQTAAPWREILTWSYAPKVALLCLSVWLHAADTLLTATVMPSAVEEIGGLAFMNWTLTLYELASILAGAAAGLLAARHGLRTLFMTACLVYAVGCVMSALAPNMAIMLTGRLLQGFGGGGMVALSFVALTQMFPERLWARLMALISGAWGASALVGPLIGGLFAQAGWWQGAFWFFSAQAVVLAFAMPWLIPRGKQAGRVEPGEDSAAPFPLRRLALLSLAILAVASAGVIERPALAGLSLLAGLLLGLAFLRLDSGAIAPLLPRRPLAPSRPMGQALGMILTLSAGTVTFTVYGPLLLQELHGIGPLAAGYMIALESVAWTLGAIAFAGVARRWEPAVIRAGAWAILLGLGAFMVCLPLLPWWSVIVPALLTGAGFGMAWAYILRRLVEHAPLAEREKAASSAPTMQLIGYALGSAIVGIAANGAGLASDMTQETARSVAFWSFAVFLPVCLAGLWAGERLARAPEPDAAA